jgi:dipeptidyl aminopeptidase/acylaminoacyl peptidase
LSVAGVRRCQAPATTARSANALTSLAATTSLPVETTTSMIPLPTPTIAGTIAFTRGAKDGGSPKEIWVVNTDGTGLKMLAGGEWYSQEYPRWSPDGSKIVYSDGDVCVMNADGSGKVRLTKGSLSMRTPSWSPDGTQIVFSNMESDSPTHRIPISPSSPPDILRYTNRRDSDTHGVFNRPLRR